MIKVRYNSNIGLNYFYDIEKGRKAEYPSGYFFWLKPSRKKIRISKTLYRRIIGSYFKNYFSDFYSHKKVQYFPLSGKLYKVKGNLFYSKGKERVISESINWIWFLRPAMNYMSNIKITKTKGSNSLLGKLERKFRENFDVQGLRVTRALLVQLINNDKLYKEC